MYDEETDSLLDTASIQGHRIISDKTYAKTHFRHNLTYIPDAKQIRDRGSSDRFCRQLAKK